MSRRPTDPPREPYGALAVFLLVPLVAATAAFGGQRAAADARPGVNAAPPAVGHVGASLTAVPAASVEHAPQRTDAPPRARGTRATPTP